MSSPVRILSVNERGVPQAPADVVRRLGAIDPALGLKCYRWGVTDSWAVVWTWDASDPRMARVQAGEIDPASAIDILGYLPLDAKPEDAVGLVTNSLRSMQGGGYGYVDAVLERVKNANAATKAEVWAPTLDKANDAIETKASGLFSGEKGKIAKVSGYPAKRGGR